MLFNSIDFAIFLPIVFCLYWFFCNRNHQLQNGLLVVASYIFYGWWDWTFLALLVLSTVVDFCIGVGLKNANHQAARKILLWISIIGNLSLLGFFKYFNFFADSFVDAFTLFGYKIDRVELEVVLPVGISFYTFQALSYTIDVYKRKLEPSTDFVQYAAFVSFFPQLVAGPIERAVHMLPQFGSPRKFLYSEAADGSRQILWGLFKKMVIADNCAVHADVIFGNSATLSGSTLLLGAVFFAIQIYCDFSGYSDIAIGTARLFGFDLMRNFAFPYFSRDIAEFWRRWHISLSTWFRDYLYFPLGGSRGGLWKSVRNTFIVFAVSGLWHGANWTYVIWGLLNALYFLPLLIAGRNRANLDIVAEHRKFPSIREFIGMVTTFGLAVFAWIFFRAENVGHALGYISGIFSKSLFTIPAFEGIRSAKVTIVLVILFFMIEWFGRRDPYPLANLGNYFAGNGRRSIRWAFCYSLGILIFLFGVSRQEFIYFQF